jgi:hypothetical protein
MRVLLAAGCLSVWRILPPFTFQIEYFSEPLFFLLSILQRLQTAPPSSPYFLHDSCLPALI